jgi:predicted  nucleic acid-binding Zn-ribbon protein
METEAWLALAGTVMGGAGLKVVESVLGRSKNKNDSQHVFREELRAELVALRTEAEKLRDEADELRVEIDKWRTRYFSLVSSIAGGDLEEARRKITENNS